MADLSSVLKPKQPGFCGPSSRLLHRVCLGAEKEGARSLPAFKAAICALGTQEPDGTWRRVHFRVGVFYSGYTRSVS